MKVEYLLKLRVKRGHLTKEITEGLKEEYGIETKVMPQKGEIEFTGLGYMALGFEVYDEESRASAPFLAVGYDGKYRIYGYLEPYCSRCNLSFSFSKVGKYCGDCGERIKYRV